MDDPNLGAVQNLGNVFANLRNQDLQRAQWAVQQPILQTQAGDAHRLATSQATLGDLQAKAAQREWAKQNLTLDPALVTSVANPVPDVVEPMPAISLPATEDSSPSVQDSTPSDSPTLPVSKPVPAVTPPTNADDTDTPSYGPDDPVPASARFANNKEAMDYLKQGAPTLQRTPGDSETPGSTASPTPAVPRSTPNLSSTAGGDTSATAPTLPPVDASESVNRPFTAADLLTTPFYDLPKEAQSEILRQGHEQMTAAGFKITDQELIQHYNENQAKALPLLSPQALMAGGMVPKSYSQEHGLELVNPGLGGASGQPGNQQFHYDALTGQNVENKNFWTDDVIQKNRNEFAQHQIAAQQLQQVQQVLKTNPGVVGAVSGGKAGQLVRQAAAAMGYTGPYTDENTLRQWLADQMKTVMGSVSNVKNQQEFDNLQKSITDPKWTVQNWNDAIDRAGHALRSEHATLADSFKRHGLSPMPDGQLPDVDVTQPGVTAPGGAATISTKAEFDALPKGATFTWGPTGQSGKK